MTPRNNSFKQLLLLRRGIVSFFALIFLTISQAFAQPKITSLSPLAAPVGSTIVITGSGFSTVLTENIVWFGPVRANVLSANPNSLTVSVPDGAGFQQVSVSVANLTSYSQMHFTTTFASCPTVSTSFYNPKIDISTGSYPSGTAAADLDGDGKADLFTLISGAFSIYKNISTPGNISFALRTNFTVSITGNTSKAICNDINGDGKLDILIFSNSPNALLLYINTSNPGSFSFAAPLSFALNFATAAAAVGDLDADGKPDLVLASSNASQLFIMKNTGTAGVVNFDGGTGLSIGSMFSKAVIIDDFNKDGKPDIASIATTGVSGQSDSLFVFANNSMSGDISFLPRSGFTSPYILTGLTSGDLDGDGFSDLVVASLSAVTVNTYMNTGSATINFVNRFSGFNMVPNPSSVTLTDVNGDGRTDIAVGDATNGTVSVLQNLSSSGNASFAPKIDFACGYGTRDIYGTDWDGDGRTDLSTGNFFSNTISIFRPVAQKQIYLVDASKSNNTPLALCDVKSADWNNACNDLQATINAARPGDQIWVAAGTYYPSTDTSGNTNPADPSTKTFTIKNGISLYGGFAGTENSPLSRTPFGVYISILDGKIKSEGNAVNVNTVVSFSNCDNTTLFTDFTITGGASSIERPGGGFRLFKSFPIIGNCIVSKNIAAGRGAAFYLENSPASIVGCRITSNTAAYGAAFDLVQSNAKLINCTIAKNSADTAASLQLENGSTPVITNSIIWGNINKSGRQDNLSPAAGATITYSMISQDAGVYPGTGNMNTNPIFADAGNDIFSPVTGSPAVGTGNPAAYPANGPSRDILFYPSVYNGKISIGAYQADVPPILNAAKILYVNQQSAAIFPTGQSWNDAFSNLNDALIVSNLSGLVKEVWVAKGTYTPTHGLTGMPVLNTTNYLQATFLVRRIKLYGGFAGNEISPDQRNINTNATLLEGFVPNGSGGYRLNHVVWTMGTQGVTIDGFSIARGSGDGVYGGGSLLAEQNPIVINNCKIFDNRRQGGLWIYGAPATISNTEFWDNNAGNGGALYTTGSPVTITDCYFHDNVTSPTTYPMNAGGAVYNAGGTTYINNCRFERNAVDNQGAAIYSSNSPYDSARTIIKNCWFTGNLAKEGSAVYNLGGRMFLTNCVISKNNDNTGFGYGPVYNYSGILQVTNSTVTNNFGGNASGIIGDGVSNFPSSTVIKNSIVWGNKSTQNPASPNLFNRWKYYSLEWFTANNSDIGLASGTFPGIGNINSDPKFADSSSINLDLLAGSPCINTGSNLSYDGNLVADTTLKGVARLMGDSIEIGAMEYTPAKISNGRLGSCTNYSPIFIDATNNNSWVPLTDDEGNLVADIKANGNNLGTVNYSLLVRNGSLREDAPGHLYLNRNVVINPTVQPSTPVDIRIYITRQEFDLLRTAVNSKGVGTGMNSINDIAFYKNENHLCEDALEPATTIVPVNGRLYADGYMLTASVSSFSAFYMSSVVQSSLPLSLLSFTGRQIAGNVSLNWVTTNEINTSLFSIEKSKDGSHFESIGKLAAKNSTGENRYSFIDTAAFTTLTVYYRLRQVDLDGKFVYSPVIMIHGVSTAKPHVTISPNPVTDIINLQLNLPSPQQVEWMIVDNAGRALQRGKIAANAGILTTQIVPHRLRSGIYYLIVKSDNFEQKVKLVKVN
ncbi:MAG: FG-GAP-like repeat-containing protein [Chitinophagaceae bacterium]